MSFQEFATWHLGTHGRLLNIAPTRSRVWGYLVVSLDRGTPIQTPKYYSAHYSDPQNRTPNFGKPQKSSTSTLRDLKPLNPAPQTLDLQSHPYLEPLGQPVAPKPPLRIKSGSGPPAAMKAKAAPTGGDDSQWYPSTLRPKP